MVIRELILVLVILVTNLVYKRIKTGGGGGRGVCIVVRRKTNR